MLTHHERVRVTHHCLNALKTT